MQDHITCMEAYSGFGVGGHVVRELANGFGGVSGGIGLLGS